MVVDDDVEFLEEIEETLTLSGYDTTVFSSGESALEAIREVGPDVILLDLKMNVLNGFQVARELSANPGTARIPILAMTGHFTESEHRKLMEIYGIRGCLLKPLNLVDVISRIERL